MSWGKQNRFMGVHGAADWLRLEGAAIFLGAAALYGWFGFSWVLFAVLFLAPDLFMIGYLRGPRVGAFIYNLAHVYVGPIFLAGLGLITGNETLIAIGLIWAAHIGIDRLAGYGLKLPEGFKSTHLG